MKIEINDQEAIIDGVKYVKEPAAEKPRELEPDRLYYRWDDGDSKTKDSAIEGKYIEPKRWDHIEPVNRWWDELTEDEKDIFRIVCERVFLEPVSMDDCRQIYTTACRLIAIEGHL